MFIRSGFRTLTQALRDGQRRSRSHAMRLRILADRHFPNACVLCSERLPPPNAGLTSHSFSRAFCRECESALPWWRVVDGCPRCGAAKGSPSHADASTGCPRCLAECSPLHRCRTLLRYEGELRRLIPAAKKPHGTLGPEPAVIRAIEHLLGAFADHLAKEATTGIPGVDLVTSLPLHPRRRRQRGFNQADLLAKRIAEARCLPFVPELLTRIHDTVPQASLKGQARRRNVAGAFVARGFSVKGRRVAVMDDVLTTGSSLTAAANALLEAGALEVVGITLSATLPAASRRPDRSARRPIDTYTRTPPQG